MNVPCMTTQVFRQSGFSTSMAEYDCVETYADWIELLGEIYGEPRILQMPLLKKEERLLSRSNL